MKKYTKFEYVLTSPKNMVVMFHDPKNEKYLYNIVSTETCFEFKPQKEERLLNGREILRFERKNGFTTFNSVLEYIERYF